MFSRNVSLTIIIISFHALTDSFHRYSLMTSCWLKNPDERPCFSEVVEVLNSILEPLADYIDFTEFYTKNLNA